MNLGYNVQHEATVRTDRGRQNSGALQAEVGGNHADLCCESETSRHVVRRQTRNPLVAESHVGLFFT